MMDGRNRIEAWLAVFWMSIIMTSEDPKCGNSAIIGSDDRLNIYEIEDLEKRNQVRQLAGGVCLFTTVRSVDESDPDYIKVEVEGTLEEMLKDDYSAAGAEVNGIEEDVRFLKEPVTDYYSFGTGFLVDGNKVMTAAHCVEKMMNGPDGYVTLYGEWYTLDGEWWPPGPSRHRWHYGDFPKGIDKLAVVFGYYKDDEDDLVVHKAEGPMEKDYILIPKTRGSVYWGKDILAFGYKKTPVKIGEGTEIKLAINDYAIIELNEDVDPGKHSVIPIDKDGVIQGLECSSEDEYFTLGCPKGLPIKFMPATALSSNYEKEWNRNFFRHTCDTWVNASGSPVIWKHSEVGCPVLHIAMGINVRAEYAGFGFSLEGGTIVEAFPEDPGEDLCADFSRGNQAMATYYADLEDVDLPSYPPEECGQSAPPGLGHGGENGWLRKKVEFNSSTGMYIVYNEGGSVNRTFEYDGTLVGTSTSGNDYAAARHQDELVSASVEGWETMADEYKTYWDYDNDQSIRTTTGRSEYDDGLFEVHKYRRAGQYRLVVESTYDPTFFWAPTTWFLDEEVEKIFDETIEIDVDAVVPDVPSITVVPPVDPVNHDRDLLVGVTEVTQRQYYCLTGKRPFHFDNILSASHPAENITFYDAVLYCNELSKELGFDTAYQYSGPPEYTENGVWCVSLPALELTYFDGFRLPDYEEWQWIYLAEHEPDETGGFYWTEGEPGEYAWYEQNSGSEPRTHPVGEKRPSDFGLYDMAGNVAEWIWSEYGGAAMGGAYSFPEDAIDMDAVFPVDKNTGKREVGFRVVRERRCLPRLTPRAVPSPTGHVPLSVRFGFTYEKLPLPSPRCEFVRWDFGDGAYSLEESPLHTYTEPGTYTVTLRVVGECLQQQKMFVLPYKIEAIERPDNFTMSNETVMGISDAKASENIVVGPDMLFEATADVTLTSGAVIRFIPETRVKKGAYLRASVQDFLQ